MSTFKEVRKKRKAKFSDVSNILPKVVEGLGLDKRLHEQAFFSIWPSLVDAIYVSRTRPLYLDTSNNLVVAVQDSSTAQELSFHKTALLKKLRETALGLGLTINGIRFDLKRFYEVNMMAEPVSASNTTFIVDSSPSETQLNALTLNDEERAELASLKTTVSNQQILNLAEKRLRLRKWHRNQKLPFCQCGEPLLYQNVKLCRYCVQLLKSNNSIENKSI